MKTVSQSGFSLIEVLVTLIVVAIIASFVWSQVWSGKPSARTGEVFLNQIAERITLRRFDAVRLNRLTSATSLDSRIAPPLEIDFANPATTASLVTDGVDADGDGRDDNTNLKITVPRNNSWDYGYQDDALKADRAWRLVADPAGLNLPGNAVLVTNVSFDGAGRAFTRAADGTYQQQPQQNAFAFWFICYAYESGGERLAMIGVAVHPSGEVERFRYSDYAWTGFGGRRAN